MSKKKYLEALENVDTEAESFQPDELRYALIELQKIATKRDMTDGRLVNLAETIETLAKAGSLVENIQSLFSDDLTELQDEDA